MSTYPLYVSDVDRSTWDIDAAGAARFSWEYGDGRERLLALYQKGKDKQWDATTRIDWDIEVDPYNALGVPPETQPLYGTDYWDRLSEAERGEMRQHSAAWQFSQFLHGEQGALVCSARITESVPDLDAKFYAATQTMDEARHVEIYSRFLHEKIGLLYPANPHLRQLLADSLSDSRWDMPYLGMQVLIEGLALAAFGLLRDTTTKPLPRQILAYVMQDEARHVAFGRMALRDYYKQLTSAELAEREDFAAEGCYMMKERLTGHEILEHFGFSADEAREITDKSEMVQAFRGLLFSRIVPCVKDIGLWGPRLIRAYEDIGVLDYASGDLDKLMRHDEEVAEQLDRERFAAETAARQAEVDATIASGADDEAGQQN